MSDIESAPAAPRQGPDFHVWLVEDNSLFRQGITAVIGGADGMDCGLAAGSCEEALSALDEQQPPDMVLMDIGLPGMSGIEGVARFRAVCPDTRIVMLTVHEEDDKVFAALCAGASGYLLKSLLADEIVEAVRQVEAGAAPINPRIAARVLDMFTRIAAPETSDYGLTPREREILHLLVESLTARKIAERLIVSYHTVDTHIRHIYEKLHVHSRSGAVARALKERLV